MKYTKEAFNALVQQVENAEKQIKANVRTLPVRGLTVNDWKRINKKNFK